MALSGIVLSVVMYGKSGDYKKFTEDPILYCKTVKKLNDVVLENNFPPMIATRNYAYANIAAYETMVAGNPAISKPGRADQTFACDAKTGSR